jgi:hypothetical protein
MTIVNTRADLDALKQTDPAAYAAFIAQLKGSLTRKGDTREYPSNYDHSLKAGDPGYLAPVIGDIADDSSATRFGFTAEGLQATS